MSYFPVRFFSGKVLVSSLSNDPVCLCRPYGSDFFDSVGLTPSVKAKTTVSPISTSTEQETVSGFRLRISQFECLLSSLSFRPFYGSSGPLCVGM